MDEKVEYDILEDSLNRCGASWDAAQTHGLLTGRLAIGGVPVGPDWLLQVLENVDESNAIRKECEKQLDILYQSTFWQLSERKSEFVLLLPDDAESVGVRTEALAHWSEGFLHGLVTIKHSDTLKKRLASEPLSEIIKDVLQITQVELNGEINSKEHDEAYFEIVEYLRVVAQLCFEELADIRNSKREAK